MKQKIRIAVLAVIFAILGIASLAPAGQPAGVDLALCVGATGYQNFPALSAPFQDAMALADELEAAGDFRRIIVLSDLTPDGQPNQTRFLPTRKNIVDMITLLARTAPGNANIFIYLGGYAELRNGQPQFLPVDAVAGDGLPLSEIVSILDGGRAAVKFVAVDAASVDETEPVPSGRVDAADNTIIVYSHEDEQRPLIDSTTGRGLFSLAVEYVLLSLDGDVSLTCGQLLSRVNRYMSDYCLDNFILAGQSSTMHIANSDLTVLKARPRTARSRRASSVVVSSIAPAVSSPAPATPARPAAAQPETRPAAAAASRPEPVQRNIAVGPKAEGLRARAEEMFRGKDYHKALALFSQAADEGDPAAENALGDMYFEGLGMEPDFARAKEFYQKSANRGFAPAQDNLGFMLEYGIGGDPELGKAVEWYAKANDQGYAPAIYHLARMYREGKGIDASASRSGNLFKAARDKKLESFMRELGESGYTRWQFELGLLYQEGMAAKNDWRESADWFKKLANHPRAPAMQRMMGDRFYYGNAVPQNYQQSVDWYRRGAEAVFAPGGK